MPGHGVFLQTGTEGRGWLSGTSFLGLGGASGKGRCTVVSLWVAGLNLLGVALFLFSTALSILMLGLVSGSGGLNWLVGTGPIFSSTSKKVFIFLMIMGWGQSLVLQGVHLISCVFPVSSKYMCALHGCDFHFHIHHFYWEFSPKETMQEVAFWLK